MSEGVALLPCSAGQRSLWLLSRLGEANDAYHIAGAVWLGGEVDAHALQGALDDVVERHEALRTALVEHEGRPWQAVAPTARLTLRARDLSRLPRGEQEPTALMLAHEEARRPFRLEEAPLARAALLRLGGRSLLVLVLHHAIADGWSLGLLVEELGAAWRARREGRPHGLPAPPLQLVDLTVWHEEQEESPAGRARLEAYAASLDGLRSTELPALLPRPARFDPRCARVDRPLTPALVAALEGLARAEGCTPFVAWLTAMSLFLHRVTGERDLGVGVPLANREAPASHRVIGYLANLGVARCAVPAGASLRDLLRQHRPVVHELLGRQSVSFERLVERCRPARDASRHPLVQVAFGVPDPLPARPFGELVTELAELEPAAAKLDLVVEVDRQRPRLRFEVARALFEPAVIGRYADLWVALLDAAVRSPDLPVEDLDPLGAEGRRALLALGAGPALHRPLEGVAAHVIARARQQPDAPALEEGDRAWSYAELLAAAGALAHALAAAGVGRGDRVGLLTPRGAALIVGELAILLTGAAFVPLDPRLPDARLAAVYADAGLRLVLTAPDLAPRAPGPTLPLDVEGAAAFAPAEVGAQDLAYVIFTSGSTGRPKGVAVPQGALLDRCCALGQTLGHGHRHAQGAAQAFDAHPWEVWTTLLGGGTVVTTPADLILQPPALARWLVAQRVRSAFAPTPVAEALLDQPWPADAPLRALLTGGDRLRRRPPPGLPFVLYNAYGPTESTIYATIGAVSPEGDDLPDIGAPAPETALSLRDARGALVPLDVPGELCVGGRGLAWGYLGRPAETAERFVPDPDGPPGARLYRTGDLASWRADGRVRFHGRVDRQVQLRGVRIEPAEVERALEAHVQQAAVLLQEDAPGGPCLVAWVVPRPGPFDPAALRAALAATLPAWMIPAQLVPLPALPLTATGKLDHAALPAVRPAAGEPPRTPMEAEVARTWSALLGLDGVGRDDELFALGGHSLLASEAGARLSGALGVDVPTSLMFEALRVSDLALRLEALVRAGARRPLLHTPETTAPLTWGQRQLWWEQRLAPRSDAYNMVSATWIEGPLDVAALERALAALVHRHPGLRSRFREADGEPRQLVVGAPERALTVIAADSDADALRRAAERASQPFDLGQDAPLRAALLAVSPVRHALLLVLHHIVADGWSTALIARELRALYRAARGGEAPPAPPAVDALDLARWEARWLTREALEPVLLRWRERLADLSPLALPVDRPHREGAGPQVVHPVALAAEPTVALRRLARAHGATPNVVLLTAFVALLRRLSGQADLCVGTPHAGRDLPEVQGLVAYLVRTLPVRVQLPGDPSFRALLAAVDREVKAALADHEAPLMAIVEAAAPVRDPVRRPLYQVMFSHQHEPPAGLGLDGLVTTPLDLPAGEALFELALDWVERDGGCEGWLAGDGHLFDATTIARFARWQERLLARALAAPDARLSALTRADADEGAQLLRWGAPAPGPVPDLTLHGPVFAAAARTPQAIALQQGAQAWTYAEMAGLAAGLAARLRAAGVRSGDRVAVHCARGPRLICAMLGALAAGAAMVPLDRHAPVGWSARIVADAGARFVITDLPDPTPLTATGAVALPPEASAAPVALSPTPPQQPAYLLFTSGTTGEPKGVLVPHAAAAAFVAATLRRWGLTPHDRLMQFSSPAFDTAIEETFPVLSIGGALVLRPEELPDVARICAECEADGVTVLDLPTALWHQWLRLGAPFPRTVHTVVIGGEAARPAAVTAWQAGPGRARRLLNTYGPTEATVVATAWEADGAPVPPEVPIGRPLDGVRAYVVDEALQLTGLGMPGELLLGGRGVTQGYHGRPGMTAERFLPDPFADAPGARAYRTGDRARWGDDGALRFVGRVDDQVKVAGYRVELAAVEAALAAAPGVGDAAAQVRGGALYAWVEPQAGAVLQEAALRAQLRRQVPEYMVPQRVAVQRALPRGPSGKVDRRRLELPEAPGDAATGRPSPMEELLMQLWADVLGLPGVGRHDHFFQIGGQSLAAAQVAALVRQRLGLELPLALLFAAPTPAGLARQMEALAQPEPLPPLLRGGEGPAPLSPAQLRMWLHHALHPDDPAYLLPHALRLRGPLDVDALMASLDGLTARHEVLRTRYPQGPDGPWQEVLPAGAPLRLEPWEGEAAVAALVARPPDLRAEGPLRAALLRRGPEDHLLVVVIHHIAIDGHATGLFLRELIDGYEAARGRRAPPAPPPVQMADCARWQRARLAGQREPLRAWWRNQLAGAPALDLPADPEPGPPGVQLRVPLPPAPLRALLALAQRQGVTPFMALLTLLDVLLARVSGCWDLSTGTPVTTRELPELEGVIGLFINTVVVRTRLDDRPTFRAALDRVRQDVLDAWSHRALPFDEVVDAVGPRRDGAHHPLFDVMFLLDDGGPAPAWPGLQVEPVELVAEAAKFDLTVAATLGEAPVLTLEHRPSRLSGAAVRAWAACFVHLLEAAAEAPDTPVDALPWAPPAALQAQALRSVGEALPPAPLLLDALRARVARAPDAIAVRDPDQAWTTAELLRRAAQVAGHLQARGVVPGDRVGLCLPRDAGLVAALLGVLACGAAFVPLDPELPAARRAQLHDDAGLRLVLDAVPEGGPEAPPIVLQPAQLAYVLYTSGSTGAPKGVEVSHGALAAYLRHVVTQHLDLPGGEVPVLTSIGFDLTITALLAPLLSGHPLWMHAPSDPQRLLALLGERGRWALLKLTPSHLRLLRHAGVAPDARVVVVGGEALHGEDLAGWSGPRFVNEYGPTEAVVGCCSWEAPWPPPAGTLPIGAPHADARLYVLDERQVPTPDGVAGELYIGGSGLAQGYRARARATAERFLPDPWGAPGGRMYRTGDRVRRRPDGALIFLGRLDDQLKVRGHRVEPAEIEATLLRHPQVSAAVVRPGPRARLLAWVTGDAAPADLLAHARALLPAWMVPDQVVRLDALPLTPNGKVDAARLPEPPEVQVRRPPATALEAQLADVWSAGLGQPVDVEADLFADLGASSIDLIRLAVATGAELGRELPLPTLFHHPSVRQLARHLEGGPSSDGGLVPLRRRGDGTPIVCVHAAIGRALSYTALARALPAPHPVWALEAPGFDGREPPLRDAEALVDRHLAALLTRWPAGPLALVGHSSGGGLAHALACRLAALGRAVELLAVLDTTPDDEPGPLPDDALLLDNHLRLLRSVLPDAPAHIDDHAALARLWQEAGLGDGDPAQVARALAVERGLVEARRGQRLGVFPGRLVLLRTAGPPGDWGWGAYARDGVEVVPVEGDHVSMMAEPAVHTLAAQLAARLTPRSP